MVEELLKDINRAKDPKDKTDLEKKHLPIIDAPDKVKAGEPFEVAITVGKLLAHPNEAAHHIQWIALLNKSITLGIVQLTPVTSTPKVKLTITLEESTTLRALERCNLHGEWEYSKEIEVG